MTVMLGTALVVAVGTLAYLLMLLRADVRRCALLVARLVDLPLARSAGNGGHDGGLADGDTAEPDGWPSVAAIQPGQPAPAQLREASDGRWMLAVLGSLETHAADVLPEGESLQQVAARYQVLAAGSLASKDLDDSTSADVEVVALPNSLLADLPLPSCVMIDPEGIVQGVGPVVSGAELLAFIAGGEHQGFGPQTHANVMTESVSTK